jgi:PTH1 family peptidyl-tRNA hydrolase
MDAASLIQKLFPRGSGGAQGSVQWIVIGLGNPGPKYRDTRHNVGWWVIDDLAARNKTEVKSAGSNVDSVEIDCGGQRVLIARPLTFVNRSGDALRYLMRKHSVTADRMIVIYDDLNLAPGKIRIRKQGGAGGHNGMKSVIDSLGTNEFARIRLGIGRPMESGQQVDYVLGRMPPQERDLVRSASTRAADAVESVIADGIDNAMNRFNA